MNTVTLARGFVKNSLEKNPTIGHWLAFGEPGKVTLRVGKVNFGQGISTALTQIAAEELDVALTQIIHAPINTQDSPDEGVTSGSFSIEHCGEAVRMACKFGLAIDAERIVVTAGASAPEVLVDDVIEALRRIGPVTVSVLPGREENIEFRLPAELMTAG